MLATCSCSAHIAARLPIEGIHRIVYEYVHAPRPISEYKVDVLHSARTGILVGNDATDYANAHECMNRPLSFARLTISRDPSGYHVLRVFVNMPNRLHVLPYREYWLDSVTSDPVGGGPRLRRIMQTWKPRILAEIGVMANDADDAKAAFSYVARDISRWLTDAHPPTLEPLEPKRLPMTKLDFRLDCITEDGFSHIHFDGYLYPRRRSALVGHDHVDERPHAHIEIGHKDDCESIAVRIKARDATGKPGNILAMTARDCQKHNCDALVLAGPRRAMKRRRKTYPAERETVALVDGLLHLFSRDNRPTLRGHMGLGDAPELDNVCDYMHEHITGLLMGRRAA